MRKLGWILPLLMMLLAGFMPAQPAWAEEPEMRIAVSGETVLPGQETVLTFTVPEEGTCDIYLTDGRGHPVARIAEDRRAAAGYNAIYWNGTWRGIAVPEGEWILRLEMNGRAAETRVRIGRMIPMLISPAADREKLTAGKLVTVTFWATEAGEILVTSGEKELLRTAVAAGSGSIRFPAALEPGTHTVEMRLIRGDGTASPACFFPVTTEAYTEKFRPVMPAGDGTPEINGWTVPLDITDEEAVWQALTAPVTVLDDRKDKAQVRQVTVRKEPRADSEGIGVVTMVSQGVRVLERGEEWSLIETFSSSFIKSDILNWNAPVQGYVRTALLRSVTPNQKMGLVVDKLTQRLYIFRDGKLFTSLLVSTGQANARQPYNETRSGEYLLVSRVGAFMSDNMTCRMAIRFNADDLIHEVPRIERNGWYDYSTTEPKLGTKASHGCIRVQRRENQDGINHTWLYNHYEANTKLLIWEDWQGRQIPVPADDTPVWVAKGRTDTYHSSDRCPQLSGGKPETRTYAEVSAEDSKLRPCGVCGAPEKKGTLLEKNSLYAPGGDHDPILTEARKDCPKQNRR